MIFRRMEDKYQNKQLKELQLRMEKRRLGTAILIVGTMNLCANKCPKEAAAPFLPTPSDAGEGAAARGAGRCPERPTCCTAPSVARSSAPLTG